MDLPLTKEQAHELIDSAIKGRCYTEVSHRFLDEDCDNKNLSVYISIHGKDWSLKTGPELLVCDLFPGKAKEWVNKNIQFQVHCK